jgi:hypothetical protein
MVHCKFKKCWTLEASHPPQIQLVETHTLACSIIHAAYALKRFKELLVKPIPHNWNSLIEYCNLFEC